MAKTQYKIQKGKKLGVFTKSFGNISRIKTVLLVIIMCSVSIMAFLPTSLPAYGAVEYSHIYGTVVDEDGVGLQGVTVELITGGVVQDSASSNSEGFFFIENVLSGIYSIHFKKIGYVEVTKSVTLQGPYVKLGATGLLRSLRLSTSTLSLISNPSDQVTIPFTVGNSGEKTEVVDFSVSKPNGWSTRILEQGYEVTKVSVSSGQSISLQLEVTVPLTAPVDVDYNISVTALGTTNSSLAFTVLTRTQPTAAVSGRIVDEYDSGIQGVTVDAYSSESLIQSAETSSDGSFTLEQATGTTASLHFSKDGYVEVTKTVSLESSSEKLELGKIALAKALTLHSSILNTVANPGEKLLLPFEVSNIGEDQETVQVSASKPDGWSTRILDQSGREVKNAALSSSTTLNLQLEVMIPLAATGDNSLTITAAGKTVSTLDFLINVEPTNESIIFCQFPGKWALPGDTVVFHVELKNPFGFEMRYRLSVVSEPEDWTASIKTASGESVTEIILGADESVDLVIEVESPTSAAAGENYELVVTAESTDQNVASSLPLIIALNEPEMVDEIKITTKFPEVTVEAGDVVEYQITVANLGDTNRLLFLSIAPPTDWKAVFKSGALEITRLDIDAGSSEALTIEVTPPSTVSLDSYDIPVQIKLESGDVIAETDLKVTIVGAYALSLETSTLLTSTTSGDSTSFTVTVTNTGFSYITAVGLDFDAEDDWDVTISPAQVDLLRPQESVTFNVLVDTPEGTVAGDYMVTLAGVSDQVSSSQTQVRTTVTTSTEWGLYGLGLAVVLIVVLVLVFKKFKRR